MSARNSQNGHRGFTLVELLMASALATMLMVGVLAVISQLARPSSIKVSPVDLTIKAPLVSETELDAWARLLRDELAQMVRLVRLSGNELELIGYQALQGNERQVTHRPVRVRYELVEIDGRKHVIREQKALDVRTNQAVERDMICNGLQRFAVVLRETTPTGTGAAGGNTGPAGGNAADLLTAGEAADQDNDPAANLDSSKRYLWQLRVWTQTTTNPQYERTLKIQ
ncbi:MAG: prepilin-type N-terminal cleavage/methylation domain-containing protein [Phycisphaerales bacterium]|nr:prepilin-type N-terminal cleavage/methylation domain-containing protein [Phycisphaerales bacterium]